MEELSPTERDAEDRQRARGAGRLAATPLRTRLAAMFAIGTIVAALLIAATTLALDHMIDARHSVLNTIDPANIAADQLLLAYVNQETGVRGYVLSREDAFLAPYHQGLVQAETATRQLAQALVNQPALLNLVRAAEGQARTWQRSYARPAIAAVRSRNAKYASPQALLRSKSLFDAVRAGFATLDSALATDRIEASDALGSATALLVGVLSAGLVLLVVAALLVRRSLRRWVTAPLEAVAGDARAVAAGDLAHRIAPAGPPDFVALASDVEAMRERIAAELVEVEAARAEAAARNEELNRSNAELEQFAYVASHDLQEPLRKVTSFVQLLQQRYGNQLDERADQYIDFAVDGAQRMQALINDLLAFSRVGRTTDQFELIALDATIEAALSNLRLAITESGADVRYGRLPAVLGDPGLLTALWQNLIGNSIKFCSAQAPVISIDAVRAGEFWECHLTDNGIGIEPRFADRIFIIFQRLHGRDVYGGTGIGLALCKKIVEFHGGTIWLDVDHHSGTRMCFTLPHDTKEEP